ncbi:MAG: ABC transporter permease [Butyrivibrio sp.]|nr:ABC transporter permease [Butyrivibrio sp.]
MIKESIKMSVQNIKSNKMRSFLTMLGIMIGVASVIGLISIVQTATDYVMGQFSELGAGTITVMSPGTALKTGLTEKDIDSLRNLDGVDGIAPSVSQTVSAISDGEIYDNVTMDGVDVSYFDHNDIIKDGRAFREFEADGYTQVCIVDDTFVSKVLKNTKAIGQTVHIGGYDYLIIGIQGDSTNLSAAYSDTSNSDGNVMVPYRNVMRMTFATNITNFNVYVEDDASTSEVETALRQELDRIYNEADNAFSVINLESLVEVMGSIKSMLTSMLGGIASIALLVGGIGIMNMMLTSVSERTKEIGLRKALGAEPARIQVQFLMESIILSLMGGFIGIILGLIIAFVGANLMNVTFAISWGAIALGVGFSAAVGIIFGWMPAKRASELNPIDALRAE